MPRPSKRALATAILLLFALSASVFAYYANSLSVQREVIVNSVEGELNSGDTSLNLSYFYPRGANGQIFFKQGESFYIYLYFEGNGNVQDVSVTTPGFVGQVLAPPLPLSVDNSTEPSVVILQIFATSCCFNGTVNFNVNATP